MNGARHIDPAVVRQLLEYCPDSGKLFWKHRDQALFADTGLGGAAGAAARWNGWLAGAPAFTAFDRDGYCVGKIYGRSLFAHRVAWVIYYGEWPDGQIDHINHNRADNRISNLRVVSDVQNSQNRCISIRNTSGVVGVTWRSRDQLWYAAIGVQGKDIFLGAFAEKQAAIAARKAAEIKFGFHPNHGAVPSHAAAHNGEPA